MIPVVLEYGGKKYEGNLSTPNGMGGGDQWQLTIGDSSSDRGMLRFSEKSGWSFQTHFDRHDDWAQILGKFVEDAHPERSFKAKLPPPFKMLEFHYEGDGLKALIEVHSEHAGGYYLKIKDRTVNGRKLKEVDHAYFYRRQPEKDGPCFWHFTHYWYKDLIEAAGARIDEYEKHWKDDPRYELVRDFSPMSVGYVPKQR